MMNLRLGMVALAAAASAGLAQGPAHPGDGYGGGNPGVTTPNGWDSHGLVVLGHIGLADFPGNNTTGNDCWGYVSPSGREYALIGLQRGIAVVEVTEPTSPVIVEFVAGPDSTWHDVKVIGDWAYAVSEGGGGIQVIDLRQVDAGIVSSPGNVGSGPTHNIAANPQTGFLYRTGGGDNGLRMYDTSPDPSQPRFVGEWNDYYVHDAQVVVWDRPGPLQGRELAFCCVGSNRRLRVVDVTDKANPTTVGVLAYSDGRYSHQGWLSPDQRYFYLNDELDERDYGHTTRTRVIDVSDPTNPSEVAWFTNGSSAIDHNLYTHGDYLFESNYRSGLRVFDASADPTQPVEVAWLDTYPPDDAPEFDGSWSNYPYLPSGTIIISDIQQGMVLVRLYLDRIDFDFPSGRPDHFASSGAVLSFTAEGVGVDLDPASAEVCLEINGVEQGVAASEVAPGEFEATLPRLECGSTVRWWLRARSTVGEAFTAPPMAPDLGYFEATVADEIVDRFHDDFESDLGWVVENDPNLTAGAWERGVPVNSGRADPPHDFDGSGQCYLTENVFGDSDIDNGWTRLTSPAFDTGAGERLVLSYARWFSNNFGNNPGEDVMEVEVSADGGAWQPLETVGPTGLEASGGWFEASFDLRDAFDPPPAQLRVRFTAGDLGGGSVVEAAVDAVRLSEVVCDDCVADINGDGSLDVDDFFAYLDLFAAADPRADVNGDGSVDVADFFAFLDAFAAGCD